MGLFNDIFDKMMEVMQDNLCDKAKEMLEERQLKNKLIDMENELDTYLVENYGNEVYFNSLDKYIHDGKVNPDINSYDEESVFYYTLLRAFLNSDDNFLGEKKFWNFHWDKIQNKFPNRHYDKAAIKKCLLHYYNVFKIEFANPSDPDRALVNALKETVNENSDEILRTITDEGNLVLENINSGIEKFLKHVNSEADVHSPREQISDYNDEYQKRLQDPLFLESDIDDANIATLKNVYIKPHIDFHFGNLKQWAENDYSRILLLYGKAGIGKTSYTSWLSHNNDFTQGCHILELRKCIKMLDSKNPWESIKKSFKCVNDDEYQNKVLILDGLDEVCVLKSDFDGQEFILNLNSTLKTGIGRSIRIIITSRMGYFNGVKRNNNIDVATIYWGEDSIIEWCNAYCEIHNDKVDWCESFKKSYTNLRDDDKRKEVFCTPLILYICCVSQVDISKHTSVASIYDEAFSVIGARRYNEWVEVSKKEFEINRQFTKELAFQMFLNDKLEDVLNSDFIQMAKEKVVNWAREKWSCQIKELEFEKLFAINHFAYGKNNAIEFAHKTIGEYFTAVKLYEDYFEKIDESAEKTWRNIFNAFRHKSIPQDILQYLVELILNKSDDNWKEKFFKAYYIGIEKQLLTTVACLDLECYKSNIPLIRQIQIAFRNLTWLLTSLGFKNDQFNNTTENLQILASYFYGDINICGWKNLENINLSHSYLECSRFINVDFKFAIFISATLSGTNFNNSDLKKAKFAGADLTETSFIDADLSEADLTGADLRASNLSHACLSKTRLEGVRLAGAEIRV